jgi:hypothetical protein
LADRVAGLTNVVERPVDGRGEWTLPAPIPADLRGDMTARRAALAPFLKPAASSEIRTVVASLMRVYSASRNTGVEDAHALTKAYAAALEGSPLWAVSQVCRDIMQGRVEALDERGKPINLKDFAPTGPRLRSLVDKAVQPLRDESYDMWKLLRAQVLPSVPRTAEQQARVDEQVEAWRRTSMPQMNAPASRYTPPSDADLVAHYARKEPAGA